MDNIIWFPFIVGTICVVGSYLGFGLERLFFVRGVENPPSLVFPKKAKKVQRINLLILGMLFYAMTIIIWAIVSGLLMNVLPYQALNQNSEEVKAIRELDEAGIKLNE